MFEVLSERLNAVLQRLTGRGRLTEKDVDEALREVRMALLEADVNFKVVKEMVARVREKAIGADVLGSLTPGQQVVKIVYDELTTTLGGVNKGLEPSPKAPSVALLVGLQGSGKTTTVAKLGLYLKKRGHRPLLAAADPYRPAAAEQLAILAQQIEVPCYRPKDSERAVQTARLALEEARRRADSWLIVDTAGRLHIDQDLMAELAEMRRHLTPAEVLLVVDAMTGQEAVRVAQEFQEKVGLTGLILTKMDGDARGGAALSITSVTGLPIKFMGTGEKTDALEPYHPERLASRILGMGDILTLAEKAQEVVDQKQALEAQKKLRAGTMDLEDFLGQLRQMKKMGPLAQILDMIPGFPAKKLALPDDVDESHLKRIEAIILSMTPEERRHPEIIGGSRRRRIARGSGTSPHDINQLLNQFEQMRKIMKQMASGKVPRNIMSMLR
ncbi:MAG: signal recognition particle protein [Chloroflexi bacterium]|nr:signal recognition particle protein [Chloroflexota bacterium]